MQPQPGVAKRQIGGGRGHPVVSELFDGKCQPLGTVPLDHIHVYRGPVDEAQMEELCLEVTWLVTPKGAFGPEANGAVASPIDVRERARKGVLRDRDVWAFSGFSGTFHQRIKLPREHTTTRAPAPHRGARGLFPEPTRGNAFRARTRGLRAPGAVRGAAEIEDCRRSEHEGEREQKWGARHGQGIVSLVRGC
jgi:hypothetical protein